jgi:hypothetical protein
MNQIDYELGLASKCNEDFDSADGMGAAKAGLIACNAKCIASHPLSKSKREACKGKCNASYIAKISYINNQTSTSTNTASQGGNVNTPSIAEQVATQLALAQSKPASSQGTTTVKEVVSESEVPAGMSMGAKIGIGVGVLALVVGVVVYIKTRK